MGQAESVNIRAGSREIKVKNLKQRISKETMKSLEDEFDRLQEAKVSMLLLYMYATKCNFECCRSKIDLSKLPVMSDLIHFLL